MQTRSICMVKDRASAEESVCDITLHAILDSLDKYPKKKPVFKSFCKEYGILELEELTEALGLEVLEIIDDRAYVQTMRAKESNKIEQKRLQLMEAVDQYLTKNIEHYIILSRVDKCWLVAKKVSLIVYTRNDNPVFQPFEKNETNDYFIVFVIKTADEFIADDIINSFITRGCKMIRIYEDIEIRRKLESVR